MTKFWSNVDDKEFFLLLNRFLKIPILRTIQVSTHAWTKIMEIKYTFYLREQEHILSIDRIGTS